MPGFFSNLPGLSAIPNPLNLFNGEDDTPPDSPHSSASPSRQSTMQSVASTSSKPTPILEGNGSDRNQQGRKASGASVMIAADADLESDSPRSARSGGASAVGTSGRPRGLSVVSDMSGGTAESNTRRRRNRVETFVLVKPPPTTAKNPLNLQVQLVISEKQRSRPRRPSDAVSRAVLQSSGELSSAPSTPQRQSYERLEDDPEKTPTVESTTMSAAAASGTATRVNRSNSVSSNRSSSAASAASGVSAATTASGKRIIPLYNLAVHNVVQPTIVTDAGTDSRVAKFSKRQLDIAGVGILEPSEVWLPYVGQAAGSPRPSFDGARAAQGRPVSMVSTMSTLSPATSRVEDPKRSTVIDIKLGKNEAAAQEDGAKKFFSKIFRKRGSADPLVERRSTTMPPPSAPMNHHLVSTESSNSLQVPSVPSSPQIQPSVHFPNDVIPAIAQIGHPTFGLAPSVLTRFLSETTLDPSGAIVGITSDVLPSPNKDATVSLHRSARPVGYSWTVRKWAKKSSDGWAAHLVAAAAAGLDLVSGAMPWDGDDDVVFEWVKLRVSPNGPGAQAVLKRHLAADQLETRRKRVGPPGTTTSPRPSPGGSHTSLALTRKRTESSLNIEPAVATPTTTARSKIFRRASLSIRAPPRDPANPTIVVPATISGRSSKPPSTITTGSGSGTGSPSSDEAASPPCEVVIEDSDPYDSDPEDSETPWQCSVWVKHTGQRQLIATLTPAPHHPKVIGILRIPTGVRSICLTEIGNTNGPQQPANSMSLNGPGPSQLGSSPSKDGLLAPTLARATTVDAAQRVREEIALTEENIKDVVSVTAMWLVAREEFGGLGAKGKSKK